MAIWVWVMMYYVGKAQYDENYGYFIYTILNSTAITLLIIIGWIKKRRVVIKNKFIGIGFLVVASPITILLFIYLYQFFVGSYFQL